VAVADEAKRLPGRVAHDDEVRILRVLMIDQARPK
jgi:hypothetical protein